MPTKSSVKVRPAAITSRKVTLDARELWQGIEMSVAIAQGQRVLQHQGCDPHIVRWDRGALLAQLPVNRRVMMRGLFIGVEHSDAWLQQKPTQDGFVAGSLRAYGKSRVQFTYHDEREPDFVSELNNFNYRSIAAAKICVTVGIECEPHP